MKRIERISILIALVIFSMAHGNAQSKNFKNMVLGYSDGSGNYYEITTDSIVYDPVTKEMSSSGFYDGGDPAHKSITNKEFKKVYKEYEAIFKNTGIHIENRIKTSGQLIINRGLTDERKVIIKRSNEQQKLEELLKSLLND